MCGLFGIHGHRHAAQITSVGLLSLQHRGQESAGIAAFGDSPGPRGPRIERRAAMGLVAEVFATDRLAALSGSAAIGHVRYSTSGSSDLRHAQPFVFEYAHGSVAIAHNGNLLDADVTRRKLEQNGALFQTSSDTELIVHLLAQATEPDGEPDAARRLTRALKQVEGAYSVLVMTDDQLIAARDPHGFRPLCIGRLDSAYVLSSETAALDAVGAGFVRDVLPGEMIVIDSAGVRSSRPLSDATRPRGATPGHFCVFEHVYFARPDSALEGRPVYRARQRMGVELAREHPARADVVIPVPDSGIPAALGYARESGLPIEFGIMRSPKVGRTFIEPCDAIRRLGVRRKFSPVRSVIDGQRVVVVDDSLVRGTTARQIVAMLRAAGAREVHLRISAPPTTHPCFYGIDTPTRSELIASSHTVEDIARFADCDSLGYLSHARLMAAVGADAGGGGFCSACFTGDYPLPLSRTSSPPRRRVGSSTSSM